MNRAIFLLGGCFCFVNGSFYDEAIYFLFENAFMFYERGFFLDERVSMPVVETSIRVVKGINRGLNIVLIVASPLLR